MKPCTSLFLLLPALFLSGCQTAPYEVTYNNFFAESFTDSYMYSRWLPLIEDNKTTRVQILERLGPPSRSFEGGRISIYRLMINEWNNGLSEKQFEEYCSSKYLNNKILKTIADIRFKNMDKNGSLLVVTEENKNKFEKEIIASIIEFHLILVFDNTNVLKKHALLRIQP